MVKDISREVFTMDRIYTGVLFNKKKHEEIGQPQQIDVGRLVEIQARQLRDTYKVDCLDAKQLQAVLNVGESNVYDWLKKCRFVRTIGRRKVVPIIAVANYLVTGIC